MPKERGERPERRAYSVDEYCDVYNFCRATLYNRWREGGGPRRMKVGARTLISVEAAEDYRRQCEGGGDAA
jgi:hypothetical protein